METRKFTPTVFYHPGLTLEEKLREMGMSIGEFSQQASVPERLVWDVTNGEASVSADMAVAFERVTHIPAHQWIRAQHLYDNYVLSRQPANYLKRLEEWEHEQSSMVVAEDGGRP